MCQSLFEIAERLTTAPWLGTVLTASEKQRLVFPQQLASKLGCRLWLRSRQLTLQEQAATKGAIFVRDAITKRKRLAGFDLVAF